MKVRQSLTFYGTVQGVGFRWTARNHASLMGLTGWVSNMDDGSVKMEVQGEESLIDNLIEKLENQVFVEITDIERKNLPLRTDEWQFSIEE